MEQREIMDPSATASVYDDAFQTQHHCHQQQPPGLSSLSSSSSTSSSSSNSLAFHLDLTPQACSGRVLRLLFGPLQAAGLICGGGTLFGSDGRRSVSACTCLCFLSSLVSPFLLSSLLLFSVSHLFGDFMLTDCV